jgi:hypothetical protein
MEEEVVVVVVATPATKRYDLYRNTLDCIMALLNDIPIYLYFHRYTNEVCLPTIDTSVCQYLASINNGNYLNIE